MLVWTWMKLSGLMMSNSSYSSIYSLYIRISAKKIFSPCQNSQSDGVTMTSSKEFHNLGADAEQIMPLQAWLLVGPLLAQQWSEWAASVADCERSERGTGFGVRFTLFAATAVSTRQFLTWPIMICFQFSWVRCRSLSSLLAPHVVPLKPKVQDFLLSFQGQ